MFLVQLAFDTDFAKGPMHPKQLFCSLLVVRSEEDRSTQDAA